MSRRRKSNHRRRNSAPQLQIPSSAQPSQLRQAYNEFVEEVAYARTTAEREAYSANRPVSDFLDLSRAMDVLNANPPLLTYMQTVVERQQAVREVEAVGAVASGRKFGFTPDMLRGAPSAASETSDLGAVGTGKQIQMKPGPTTMSSVPNADILRAWAEQVEWVRAAINIRREQVGRAALVVRPIDEKKPFDKVAMASIDAMLTQPNEYRESMRTVIEGAVEDILVLDRGVIEKNMTAARKPTALYASDGALFKIYTGWSGDPNEPRYLYEDPMTHRKIPLRNDEVIMMCANPATYRFGLSPVQVLRKAILADIKATESAMHLVEGKPPQHIVQMPKASKTQLSKVRDTYDQEVAGRRELLFVGGEETIHLFPLMFSAKDNQWMEWQEYLARKIATVFQISPQQLGITQDINKANGSVQLELYEDTGLIPLMLLVEEYLNREFLADFAPVRPDGRPDYAKMNLQIVFPSVSEADRIMHVERMVTMSKDLLGGQMPSATLNQVLSMRGEEPVDGGDAFWVYTAKNGQVPWLSYDPKFDWLAANGLNPDGSRAAAPLAVAGDSADEADQAALGNAPAAPAAAPAAPKPVAPKPGAPANQPAEPAPAAQPPAAPPAKQEFWSPNDGRRAGSRWSVTLQRAVLAEEAPVTPPPSGGLDLDELRRQLEDEIRKKLLEEFGERFRAAQRRKAQAAGQIEEPSRTKYSPDQERDNHGRFGSGGGSSSESSGHFDEAKWQAMPMAERRAEWEKLSSSEKNAQADAVHTIPARVDEILKGVPAATAQGAGAAVQERMDNIRSANIIFPDRANMIQARAQAVVDEATHLGATQEQARTLGLMVTDHLAAQEYEAMGRTLGDHGVRHLDGNTRMADEALAALPHEGQGSDAEHLMTSIMGSFHDTGYLTPPGRNFLDMEHKDWGQQYFDAAVRPQLEGLLSEDQLNTMSYTIATHDSPEMNWESEPVTASFRLADNLALFQREKMPSFVENVPENMQSLVDLGRGKISLDEAKAQITANIQNADLPDAIKSQLLNAVPEISPVLPKFTVGMVGAKVDGINWAGDHMAVTVDRTGANEALSQVLDLGQKQFNKMMESFGGNPEDLKGKSDVVLSKDGQPVLEIKLHGPVLKHGDDLVVKYSPDQERDDHGRFGSGGGGSSSSSTARGYKALGRLSTTPMTEDEMNKLVAREADVIPDDKKLNEPFDGSAGTDYSPDERSAQETKAAVMKTLADKLQGDSDWQALRDKLNAEPQPIDSFGDTPDEVAASHLISAWAASSGDSIPLSNALQLATQREFGLDEAATSHFAAMDEAEQTYGDVMPGLQKFVRAQYDETQSQFAAAGVTEVVGYRGEGVPEGTFDVREGATTAPIHMQPISSWSTFSSTAAGFGESAAYDEETPDVAVFGARVPVSRILSTSTTGFGCRDEMEFTMLGGNDSVWAVGSTQHMAFAGTGIVDDLRNAMVKD